MEKAATSTPAQNFITEGAQDEGEEEGDAGNTDLNMDGVANLNSELSRVHIAEKNKAMAEKLKVCYNVNVGMIAEIMLTSSFYHRH